MKTKPARREDLQDLLTPLVARRLPTIQTDAANFRRVPQSALLLAPCHKSPVPHEPPARSLLSEFRRGGARERTNVRHDLLFDSDERARLKSKCRQSLSVRSRLSHLPRDPKSQPAVAATSVVQSVSLRCCREYSSLATSRLE